MSARFVVKSKLISMVGGLSHIRRAYLRCRSVARLQSFSRRVVYEERRRSPRPYNGWILTLCPSVSRSRLHGSRPYSQNSVRPASSAQNNNRRTARGAGESSVETLSLLAYQDCRFAALFAPSYSAHRGAAGYQRLLPDHPPQYMQHECIRRVLTDHCRQTERLMSPDPPASRHRDPAHRRPSQPLARLA